MAGGQERALRRRIRTVQSTKKITRAMELIAASQIGRAQGRVAAAKAYQEGVRRIFEEAVRDVGGDAAGRLVGVPDDPRRTLILAVVGDRGLCGGYNVNVLRTLERSVRADQGAGVEHRVVVTGRKGPAFLRFRHIDFEASFSGFSEKPTFADARHVAATVIPPFMSGEVDQVFIISTRFLSAGVQTVETRQLLPAPLPVSTEEDAAPEARQGYTEFEPAGADLLEALVPGYAEASIFGALLEAAASELTARQRAMAAATENAEELIKTLSRVMNRARQDAITTEIMEIVGGAEALRQGAAAE